MVYNCNDLLGSEAFVFLLDAILILKSMREPKSRANRDNRNEKI